MQSKSALIAGILAGIASPSTIGAPAQFERLQGSDLSRMRGDVLRVGGDFSTVITRERGNKKTSLKADKSRVG